MLRPHLTFSKSLGKYTYNQMQPQVHVKSGASCTFGGKEFSIMEFWNDFCGHPVDFLWSGTGLAGASFHFQQPKSTLQQHCMCRLNVPSWDSATGLLSIRIVRLFGSTWAGHGITKAAARSTWQDDARLVWKDAQCFYIYKCNFL